MAVTTKTLAPTGQVVSIPDMTEKPNASVLSDGIGKEADAINALDKKIAKYNFETITSDDVAGNGVYGEVTASVPTGATYVVAVIPIGVNSVTSDDTFARIIAVNNRVVGFRTVGTRTQKYRVQVLTIYR